jgi:hypothetical protein
MRIFTKATLIVGAAVFLPLAASAQTTNTNCYVNGQYVNCTSTTTGNSDAAQAAQIKATADAQARMQQNLQESSQRMGNAFAALAAQRQAEKNDLTAVVFCRQNPAGSWTFSGKAPTSCQNLEKNVVAYCTVNAKTHLCKEVSKLPPASIQTIPVQATTNEEQVAANVVYCEQHPSGSLSTGRENKSCADEIALVTAQCTARGWTGKPCESIPQPQQPSAAQNVAPVAVEPDTRDDRTKTLESMALIRRRYPESSGDIQTIMLDSYDRSRRLLCEQNPSLPVPNIQGVDQPCAIAPSNAAEVKQP